MTEWSQVNKEDVFSLSFILNKLGNIKYTS